MSWLDYKLPPAPIVLINPGVNSVRDVLQHKASRTQDWKDTITTQQRIIREICERKCHEPAAR